MTSSRKVGLTAHGHIARSVCIRTTLERVRLQKGAVPNHQGLEVIRLEHPDTEGAE